MPRREPKNIPAAIRTHGNRTVNLRCVCSEDEAARIRKRAEVERVSVSRLLLELADPGAAYVPPKGWRVNNPEWPQGEGEFLVPAG